MQKFFLFLLIFILIIYVSKIIFRWVFPWLIKKFIERNMPKQDGDEPNQTKRQQKNKIIPDDKGEYIDYEEVEERNQKDS